MSMVPTFVQSRENHWYKNPVIKGPGYFVCWDDNEPIEIVAEKGRTHVFRVIEQLAAQGWQLLPRGKPKHFAGRDFGDGLLKPAVALFVKQANNGPPDALLPQDKRVATHTGDCVLYYNRSNGHNG